MAKNTVTEKVVENTSVAGPTARNEFEKNIAPILEKYCVDCHDAAKDEGDLNLERYLTLDKAEKNPELWEKVATRLKMDQMPPAKRHDRPTEEERAKLLAWSRELNQRWDSGALGRDPGHTTLRRLNRNEYNYTIRDLFGLPIRPGDIFPQDSGGKGGFDNNADALFLPPLLMENYVEAAGAVVKAVYANPTARNYYLACPPQPGMTYEQMARAVLTRFASRAYRRPVKSDECDRLVQMFLSQFAKTRNYSEAMKLPLMAALVSPSFLYRAEVSLGTDKVQPVDPYDLACRLSYFLWSSMPDDTLFSLAATGKLSDPAVLDAQITRMLKDPRAGVLGAHFAGQWLDWEMLRSEANPDAQKFPEFTREVRAAMYLEAATFFHFLVQENGSAFDLIDCNYTYLNETLARFYGIAGVAGPQIRKVPLLDKRRGGVLGMGAVLVATSMPLRTAPSVRGAYVLEKLLGTPPPAPPMDVPALTEDDRPIRGATFRAELEMHRENPNCRSCHATIDPIGFALENYDAIGRWRETLNGQPIDSRGALTDGRSFAGPADLKKLLLEDKELFIRNMVEQILAYALGRELKAFDRPVIAEITTKVLADRGGVQTAFREVAKSYPFLNRRDAPVGAITQNARTTASNPPKIQKERTGAEELHQPKRP